MSEQAVTCTHTHLNSEAGRASERVEQQQKAAAQDNATRSSLRQPVRDGESLPRGVSKSETELMTAVGEK